MHIYTRLAPGEQRQTATKISTGTKGDSAFNASPFLSTAASNRLSERFGLSPTAAAAIASLAGLGPQEVRQ